MAKSDEFKSLSQQFREVLVISNVEISPGVFRISWKRNFDFIPGQVVKIAIDKIQPPRIYSICSGNQNETISILFNIKEDGYLTPRLAKAREGDKLLVSEPYGSFHCEDGPACWIATGTGIAPFYSMVKSGLSSQKLVIHGARHLNQFYFEEEFKFAFGSNYFRCCSSEQSSDFFHGHVTQYLLAQNKFPKDFKYYLCGKSLMVVDVRDLLISKGISYNNIFSEIYF
ncbi:MAG: oxidoreductase [Mariniphaga sp.]